MPSEILLFQTASGFQKCYNSVFTETPDTMKKITPKSFEEALSRLESLTQSMQGEMPLEDALAAYQEGNSWSGTAKPSWHKSNRNYRFWMRTGRRS
ncbi:exonuclease VII small subunit [Neisseria meningitidis 2004264]|nr:exonuclease VII small subunit [Neisseria meningitidis 2004264]EOC37314.1 exonuclease VII small subunit [Neisseria meningitidis 2004264]EOC40508.1 exonuclease VII small subunit [Neisseria meningitidis 2004264]EOC40550.1 exonuclease VII small subunit [Neisseria meningitidis 2004264]